MAWKNETRFENIEELFKSLLNLGGNDVPVAAGLSFQKLMNQGFVWFSGRTKFYASWLILGSALSLIFNSFRMSF